MTQILSVLFAIMGFCLRVVVFVLTFCLTVVAIAFGGKRVTMTKRRTTRRRR